MSLEYLIELSKLEFDISEEILILYKRAKEINAKVMVELGVREGISTRALLTACKDLNAHLWSIDIDLCLKAQEIIKELGLSSYWTFIQINDLEFIKSRNKEIDLLFIDTSHTYELTLDELNEYSEFIRIGGLIFLHDSLCPFTYPGVARAIAVFLSENKNYTSFEYNTKYGLAELKRRC